MPDWTTPNSTEAMAAAREARRAAFLDTRTANQPNSTTSRSPNRTNTQRTAHRREMTLEIAPNLFASESELRATLPLVSDSSGNISVPSLMEYLFREGLEPTAEEAAEMIRMLKPEEVIGLLHPGEPIDPHAGRSDGTSVRQNFVGIREGYTIRRDTEGAQSPLQQDYAAYRSQFSPEGSQPSSDDGIAQSEARALNTRMWQAFLDRSFIVGEASCREGVLELEALEQREAYIFLGLPALTFLDMISGSPDGKVSFGPGFCVSWSRAPPGWRPIIESLEAAGRKLRLAETTDPTLAARLRLSCAADPDEGAEFNEGRVDDILTQLRGGLQSSATLLTQIDTFKDTYEGVIELICNVLKA